MKFAKRIFFGVGAAGALLCCAMLALLAWPAGGWKATSIPTGSMNPAIKPGSLVLVHSVPASSIKAGDIITYTNPRDTKQTITHRVIQTPKIHGTVPAFVTKGDANPTPDSVIVGGMVRGRIETITPYLGTAVNWLKTLPGLIAIIYIPALLIIIEEIRRLTKHYKSLLPYMAAGYVHSFTESPKGHPVRMALTAVLVPAVFVTAVAVPAHALLKSNAVSLAPNTLSVASVTPPSNCSGNTTNNTNVNVTNTNNQTATTGNASNTNNTTVGSATSGSATNNNSTNITINVNNCH